MRSSCLLEYVVVAASCCGNNFVQQVQGFRLELISIWMELNVGQHFIFRDLKDWGEVLGLGDVHQIES